MSNTSVQPPSDGGFSVDAQEDGPNVLEIRADEEISMVVICVSYPYIYIYIYQCKMHPRSRRQKRKPINKKTS